MHYSYTKNLVNAPDLFVLLTFISVICAGYVVIKCYRGINAWRAPTSTRRERYERKRVAHDSIFIAVTPYVAIFGIYGGRSFHYVPLMWRYHPLGEFFVLGLLAAAIINGLTVFFCIALFVQTRRLSTPRRAHLAEVRPIRPYNCTTTTTVVPTGAKVIPFRARPSRENYPFYQR